MNELRFAVCGAGFWAQYQAAAWGEIAGVRCVAVCDPVREKAQHLAERLAIPAVYEDARELLEREQLDFVDIVSTPETHAALVQLAAERQVAAICQKPLAPTLAEAREMAEVCLQAGVPLLVHENWRWQAPLRALKQLLDSGLIGRVFRARIHYANSFPVFENQPFLKELPRFILGDMGTHILDVARFLFGEATSLYCHTSRIHPEIRGEDVATVMMKMRGAAVVCDMSYASRVEHDRFPETFVLVEAERGSVELAPDFWLRTTVNGQTTARRVLPPRYAWANPAYDLVHASMVPCHANLVAGLRGERPAETTAADNLKTLELVEAAYESAESGQALKFK
jgi:D-apiose dehydrogenase